MVHAPGAGSSVDPQAVTADIAELRIQTQRKVSTIPIQPQLKTLNLLCISSGVPEAGEHGNIIQLLRPKSIVERVPKIQEPTPEVFEFLFPLLPFRGPSRSVSVICAPFSTPSRFFVVNSLSSVT